MPTAVAIRHILTEGLGRLEPILLEHGFTPSYLEAPATTDWSSAREADLVVVLGGPIGVGDIAHFPFLGTELEILTERVGADRPTLGICLGSQLLAVACGGSVARAPAAEIGYAPVTLSAAGRDSVLAPLAGAPVLHWHGDNISGLTPLAATSACPIQAFARGSNVLGLQFHLEADSDAVEQWLVGDFHELVVKGVAVEDLRRDAAAYGKPQASDATAVFGTWLSRLSF